MRYLLLLFIAMPIIEIGVLIRVGGWLGLWPTLIIVIITAVLGTWMLRQQSVATIMSAQNSLREGQLPAQQIFEGVLLLVGGVLLLTPGFVTDAIGFACLLPWSRRWLAHRIAKRTKGGSIFMNGSFQAGASSGFGSTSGFGAAFGTSRQGQGAHAANDATAQPSTSSSGSPRNKPGNKPGDVIEGDFKELD